MSCEEDQIAGRLDGGVEREERGAILLALSKRYGWVGECDMLEIVRRRRKVTGLQLMIELDARESRLTCFVRCRHTRGA